ncbi:MAG: hypothetical protein HamCj_00720 [Candidatus Hamiltonella defensa (Ceratovacuna japonica)]
MPIEIRELIIKATLSSPACLTEQGPSAQERKAGARLPEEPESALRWHQMIRTQLEQVLPEHLEKVLDDRFSEHALSDRIAHILARMKER